MRTARFIWLSVFVVACTSAGALATPQARSKVDSLFGEARHLEEVEGNLEAAIAAYKRVLADPGVRREMAADALLRLGHSYERLGSSEARKAYDRLVSEYGDQSQLAAEARTRLAALGTPVGAPRDKGVIVRQIWTGPDVDPEGKPSRDGRLISFIDWQANGSVAVRDLESGQNRLLTHELPTQAFAGNPVLSPDAKQVAYVWESLKSEPTEIRTVATDGSRPHTVVRLPGVYPYDLAWSPDGKRLAASFTNYGGDKTISIALVSVSDGTVTKLKSTGWRVPEIGGFSPDGRFVLYALRRTDEEDADAGIFALSVDGTVQHAIVQSKAADTSPCWTPDGGVAFVSDRSGTSDLWFVPALGAKPSGAPRLLKANIGSIINMGFTRDGTFVYGSNNIERDLYLARLDPNTLTLSETPARLSDKFVGNNSAAVWSPDGHLAAFMRKTGPATKAIVVRSMVDGSEHTVPKPFVHQYASRFGPRWFPDNQSLLLSDIDASRRLIFSKVDIQTGQSEQVFTGVWQEMWDNVALSPDGKNLVYTLTRKGHNADENQLHLIRREVASGVESELYSAVSTGVGFFGLSVSPDGAQVAFMANVGPNERTLVTIPVAGGTPRVLYRGDNTHPKPWTTLWTRDGRHILVVCNDGPHRDRVWAFPAAGGEPRKLDIAESTIASVSLSPDNRLLFTAGHSSVDVWTISNLMPAAHGSR